MKNIFQIVVVSAAVMAAGCVGFDRKSDLSGPSATGSGALMGNWSSTNIIPSPGSCTNFKWNATEQTATSAKGSFSALCGGDLQVSGNAEGTLNVTAGTANWKANGTATAPGLTSCAISLTGTAELGVDSIRIPYSGTTCLGSVSGVEVLKR